MKRYTKEDDKIIIKTITDNPGNLAEAFTLAATKLNRSKSGIQNRWYKTLQSNSNVFVVLGKTNHKTNYKIYTTSTKHKVSLWYKIINFLKTIK